jgi:6-phosphogluconate dehydrogenase
LAEGLLIIKNVSAGEVRRREDAKASPLRHPEFYRYNMNFPDVDIWRRKPEAA